MPNERSLKRKLVQIDKLRSAEDYKEAFTRASVLREEFPDNANLLILWANLAQLQDENGPALSEVKVALERAAELDGAAAAIELGYFLDNVDDDPRAATLVFADAIIEARRMLTDALIGQARALLQINKRPEAAHCLIDALRLLDNNFTKSGHRSRTSNGTRRRPAIATNADEFGSLSVPIQELLDTLLSKTAL